MKVFISTVLMLLALSPAAALSQSEEWVIAEDPTDYSATGTWSQFPTSMGGDGVAAMLDGDYSTGAFSYMHYEEATLELFYEKPAEATEAVWRIKYQDRFDYSAHDAEFTLPEEAIDGVGVRLRIAVTNLGSINSPYRFECRVGDGWHEIFSGRTMGGAASAVIYEESMRWHVGGDGSDISIQAECGGGVAWFGLRGDGANIASGQSVLLARRAEVLGAQFYFVSTPYPNQGIPPMRAGDRIYADVRDFHGNVYGTAESSLPFYQDEGWVAFGFEEQDIELEPGKYMLTVYTNVPRQCGIRYCPNLDPYPDGERFSSHNGADGPWMPWYGTIDMSFRARFKALAPEPITAAMDIKPGSCRNTFKSQSKDHGKPGHGGHLVVALLGSETLDVSEVDPSSLLLEGVAPVECSYSDLCGPGAESGGYACPTDGADGYGDMVVRFSQSEVSAAIGPVAKKDVVTLTLTGELYDGTPLEASDRVTIVGRGGGPKTLSAAPAADVVLHGATPNPFNPVTTIGFYLAEAGHVEVAIFDVSGRLVARLVDGIRAAGEQSVTWNAGDLASGVYFCRLTTERSTDVKRVVLMK